MAPDIELARVAWPGDAGWGLERRGGFEGGGEWGGKGRPGPEYVVGRAVRGGVGRGGAAGDARRPTLLCVCVFAWYPLVPTLSAVYVYSLLALPTYARISQRHPLSTPDCISYIFSILACTIFQEPTQFSRRF